MHSPNLRHAAHAIVNPADDQLLQDIDGAPNLVALFLKRADEKGDAPFLGHKAGGKWVTQSWRSAAEHVCLLAEALRAMGLQDGDRVALVMEGRIERIGPPTEVMAYARIRMAEASTQAALAHFDGVVLNAIRETQTRLAQYSALLDRRDALAEAEKSAKEAADQTHRYYQAGRESFLADLQATRTYTDMRAQLAAANSQVALGQIGVFLALGGGWKGTAKP